VDKEIDAERLRARKDVDSNRRRAVSSIDNRAAIIHQSKQTVANYPEKGVEVAVVVADMKGLDLEVKIDRTIEAGVPIIGVSTNDNLRILRVSVTPVIKIVMIIKTAETIMIHGNSQGLEGNGVVQDGLFLREDDNKYSE
jgi:hypothetical protein